MVTELHLSTYINTALAVMCFSLLIMGMSFKFGEVTIMSTWADARAFASSMASRAYTSADCFAYETMGVHYDYVSDKVVSQRRVYPGVVDIRKFNQDKYFDCIQNYFFSYATEAPTFAVGGQSFAAFFIDFKLEDLDDPSRLRGVDTLSTRNQLDVTHTQDVLMDITNEFAVMANTLFWVSMAVDITVGIIIEILSYKMFTLDVSYAFVAGSPYPQYIMYEELIDAVEEGADRIETTVPVTIRYADDEGNIEVDHAGTLTTTIYYNVGGLGTSSSFGVG